MKNNTNIKVPKKYAHMLEEIDFEGRDSGYWAYAKEGYEFAGMGCKTAHEYNQKDLMEMIRTLRPCEEEEVVEEAPKEEAVVEMYEQPIAGVSMFSEQRVTIVGERLATLEDGRDVEQYIYKIDGHTPENGRPYVSLKDNIILI